MLNAFLTIPDARAFLVTVFVLAIIAVAAGYFLTIRFRKNATNHDENAFGMGQAAIFGLIALILAFSFSFAAERFEARRALVVTEADAVGTAYLRADFLAPAARADFQRTIAAYVKLRLAIYEGINATNEEKDSEKAFGLQMHLWNLVTAAVRADPHSQGAIAVANAVNDTIDASEEQRSAINNHVPGPILGIVLLSTLVGAGLLGMTFGRARAPNAVVSIFFCLLVAATLYSIVDLDNPQGGFIHIDTAPLQNTYIEMEK
jgi:hypothetical protein